MIMPRMVLVEDDGCTKTPSWVDTGSGNGDSGQVNQEHSKSNRQWCQDLQMSYDFISILYHKIKFSLQTLQIGCKLQVTVSLTHYYKLQVLDFSLKKH